jgi:aspartate/methionine/tyrosine aminotransferase
MKKKSIIDELVELHPEVKNFKMGFPNIGKRADGKAFGSAVGKIEKAWYFYDTNLYNIKTREEIIKLGSGNPLDYKPFPMAIEYLKKQLNDSLYSYPPAAGDEGHRQLISNYLIREGFPKKINYNNIIITDSTTQAFYLILKSLFNPYDVIIMTGPNYGLFAFMPERENIGVEIINLDKNNNYIIKPEELDNKISEINLKLKNKYKNKLGYTPRVRAFLNINPHNPLGTVLSDKNLDILKGIGEVCKKNNVFIIDDLIYRDLSYDMEHKAMPIGTINKYFDNTISLFGLSKSYGLAKTRSGFIVANEVVIRLLRDNLFYIMDSQSVLQSSLLAGSYNDSDKRYKEYSKYFDKLIDKYKFNCFLSIALFEGIDSIKDTIYYNKIYNLLKKEIKDKNKLNYILEGIPYSKVIIRPESGFFLLVDFSELKKTGIIKSEIDLLNFIYKNCGVKFLVGQSFSWPNKKNIIIRITYSFDSITMIKALSKINLSIRSELNETNRSNNIR